MENHNVTIENREKITVTDVKSIDTFDEEEVCAELTEGGLVIRGRRLHVHLLDLETGNAAIEGEIQSVTYIKKKADKKIMNCFRK